MRQALTIHPDSGCRAVTHIDVEVMRPRPGTLVLRYVTLGEMSRVHLPPVTVSERGDRLWQQTCFEAFIRGPRGNAYYEFNFSPSTQWAAYGFSGYRDGMYEVEDIKAPRIRAWRGEAECEVRAALELEGLAGLPGDLSWQVGLSAVIEEADGNRSYWALAHPPGKPDFHSPECFALGLSKA